MNLFSWVNTNKERKPKERYFCPHCCVELDEIGKYLCGYYRGVMRVVLVRVVGNQWKCEKCGAVYYNGNFDKDLDRVTRKKDIRVKPKKAKKPIHIKIP